MGNVLEHGAMLLPEFRVKTRPVGLHAEYLKVSGVTRQHTCDREECRPRFLLEVSSSDSFSGRDGVTAGTPSL